MQNVDVDLEDYKQEIIIKGKVSSQFTGPIGIGKNPYDATSYCSFSEMIVCDWSSRRAGWQKGRVIISRSSDFVFPSNSIKHVQLSAWPCAITEYITDDGGWAIDKWAVEKTVDNQGNRDYVKVTLYVAVRGGGARLNRLGYSWQAYFKEH